MPPACRGGDKEEEVRRHDHSTHGDRELQASLMALDINDDSSSTQDRLETNILTSWDEYHFPRLLYELDGSL